MLDSAKAQWFWITFVIWLVIDQATKIWTVSTLEQYGPGIEVIPGFIRFIHAQNPGAAFSILTEFEYRHYVFLGFTVIAIGVVAQMYRELEDEMRLLPMALGLILSGAVGNAIDRVHKQTVTDFISVYISADGPREWLIERVGTATWPTFNIADSTLLVGVVIFLIWGNNAEKEATAEDDDAVVAADPTA
jgi:signal peptidase II